MVIKETVKVTPDKIGVHITGPTIDIMLHMGIFEAMNLKAGKSGTGEIILTVKDK